MTSATGPNWASATVCWQSTDADAPTAEDTAVVGGAFAAAIGAARRGPRDLSNRLDSDAAVTTRAASRRVRDVMAAQWPD